MSIFSDVFDDLKDAAKKAVGSASLDVHIGTQGSSANVSFPEQRRKFWLALLVVAVVAFVIGRRV